MNITSAEKEHLNDFERAICYYTLPRVARPVTFGLIAAYVLCLAEAFAVFVYGVAMAMRHPPPPPPPPPPALDFAALALAALGASSAGGGGGGGGGGCLIATAAYGTPISQELDILRELRDRYLLDGAAGSLFVDVYYRFSPPLADLIAQHPPLQTGVRWLLVPVIGIAYGMLNTPVLTLFSLLLLLGALSASLLAVRRRVAG